MRQQRAARAMVMAMALAGCRGFPVNVATPKPLEVDVTLRVDIYQHEGGKPGAAGATDTAPGTSDEETRRRGRMAQIQSFKNSRLVGEDHTGRLQVIERPSGAYGTFLEQTVAAENADRDTLMRAEAATRHVSLAAVESERAQQWRERSFPGEWIEERPVNGTWQWVQKSPGTAEPRLSTDAPPASQ